jgi:HAE1 family hydrophobic/amphiphilic exporter-1
MGSIGGLISSLFLTLVIVFCDLWNHGKLISKFTKGDKVDYEAEMVADYEHKALSEDGFNQSIHFSNKFRNKKSCPSKQR